MEATVNLELSQEEALVLFEFLSRINDQEHPDLYEDQAEQRILWDLECLLEKVLVQPFKSNYGELVAAARAKVRDEDSIS